MESTCSQTGEIHRLQERCAALEGELDSFRHSQNMPLGLDLPGAPEMRQDTVPVQPGDRLLFFTDGLYEVTDARGRQLGLDGFGKRAQATMGDDLFEVADHVFQQVRQYQHAPDTDDQTLVVAEIR